MQKSLVLVIAGTVLMITGSIVAFMTGSSLENTNQQTDGLENDSVCNYQVEQAQTGDDWKEVDGECIDSSYVPEDESDDVVRSIVEDDLT